MILSTIEPVIPLLHHVHIDPERVRNLAVSLARSGLDLPAWRDPVFPKDDDGQTAALFCTANTVNFSFWGEPKWTVTYRGMRYDGTFGLFASFLRALEEGIPIIEGPYLRDLTAEDLRHLFRGNVEIPMFDERLATLREAGWILVEKYEGSWLSLLNAANKSALSLVDLLTKDFPSFNDHAVIDGHAVNFHKRAQLIPAMLYGRFNGSSYGEFKDTEFLSCFADYKLPQILRRFGVISYGADLAHRVDSMIELPPGGREEVEIRAATIWCCELIRSTCSQLVSGAMAVQVDAALWATGQAKDFEDRPYHRTRSIFY